MARDFYVNGETMVSVKGNVNTPNIQTLTQLGLSDGSIRVTPAFKYKDIPVDAWGAGEVPADVQFMLATVAVSMTLIHFDLAVLQTCVTESMGGGGNSATGLEGQFARAGTRLGGGGARFAANNHYIGLNLSSPIGGGGLGVNPWRFFYAHLSEPPFVFPLGVEKSIVQLNWRVVPYTIDPWGTTQNPGGNSQAAGTGAAFYRLWDHTLDT